MLQAASTSPAATTVCPNANTTAAGNAGLNTVLRNLARTHQIIVAASQLGELPSGTMITGLTYRLQPAQSSGYPPVGVTANFANYAIELAPAANSPANMSTTFASNVGPGAVTVRTGPLVLNPLSFPNANNPTAFGPTLTFTTPYTYTGGDLCITIRHSGNPEGVSSFADCILNTPPGPGYGTVIRAMSGASDAVTTGAEASATIIRLTHTALQAVGGSLSLYSNGVDAGSLTVTVVPGQQPASTGITVSANLSQIGGSANTTMFDDGPGGGHGDATAGDNVFSIITTVPPGTACSNLAIPATATDAQGRTATTNITLQSVSPIVVSPAAIDENEPACAIPTDTTNGGCNTTPSNFTDIVCGQTFTGTTRHSGTTRDTDWYRVTLTQPTQITWSAIGESDLVVGLAVNSATPTLPPVCGTPITILPFQQRRACERASVTTCVSAGTWYLFIAPPFGIQYPCGRRYEAVLRCGGGACPGDMNADGARNGLDVQAFASAFVPCVAGSVINCTTCQTSDVNGDGTINVLDVTALADLLMAGQACP